MVDAVGFLLWQDVTHVGHAQPLRAGHGVQQTVELHHRLPFEGQWISYHNVELWLNYTIRSLRFSFRSKIKITCCVLNFQFNRNIKISDNDHHL